MVWTRWTAVVMLAMLLTVAPGPAQEAEGAAEPGCPVEEIPGLGPACLRPDGLYEVFAPDGRSLGTSHGPDPIPTDEDLSTVAAREPACVHPNDSPWGYYARVIYAWASDRTPTKSTETVRDLVRTANGIVHSEAQTMGAQRDLRVLCNFGLQIDVEKVQLRTPLASTSFSTIVDDLEIAFAMQGEQLDKRVFYWVYFEDTIACGCSGTAHLSQDERAALDNANNGERLHVAATFGYLSPHTMLHELAHNNGAVQQGAPHSSGGGHCNDGKDIMCYADGGWKSDYRSTVCGTYQFDCNNDDYFHVDPPATSYLGRSWNLGDLDNRFIIGCTSRTGHLSHSISPPVVPQIFPVIYPREAVHVSHCAGKPFLLEGWLQERRVMGESIRPAADMDVCWISELLDLGEMPDLTDCDLRPAQVVQGTIPHGAKYALVSAKAGVDVDYMFRAG